jgi:hypothetical protein
VCEGSNAFAVQSYKKSVDYTRKNVKNQEFHGIFFRKNTFTRFFSQKISVSHFFFVILQAEKLLYDKISKKYEY